MRKIIVMFLLCLAGAVLNIVSNIVLEGQLGLPLFLDTVFTIALTFARGLPCGIITGVLTHLLSPKNLWGWEAYLFAVCSIASACITFLFIRLFPRELNFARTRRYYTADEACPKRGSPKLTKVMDRTVVLILLSFALCIAMSVLGGSIAAAIQAARGGDLTEIGPASAIVIPAMFDRKLPVILTAILTRVPINIIDRLVTVFAAYGIAALCGKASFVLDGTDRSKQAVL